MGAEQTLQKIRDLLDGGDAAQAASLIADSSTQLGTDPRAILPLLQSLDRSRKNDALLTVVAKLQELDILPIEAAIFEMRVKLRESAYPQAMRLVEKILAAGENVEALRCGGRIGNLTRDDALALRYWERLAKAAPNDPEAALQAARIQLRRNQYAAALAHARQAADRRSDAEPLLIAVAAGMEVGWPDECDGLLGRLFAADRPRAMAALSRLVRDLEAERASRLLASLQKQFPNEPTLAEVIGKAYSGWLAAALEQELAARELDAAALYRAARIIQPRDANTQRSLDRLSSPSLLAMREAFNSRDFPNAVEHGMMAIRINPESFDAWQTVGRAQFARGNVAEASEAFERCIAINPKDANSWLMSGLVLNQAGRRCSALQAFQKARSLSDSEVKKEAEASIAALHPLLVRDAQQAAIEGNVDQAWKASDAALAIRSDDAGMMQLRKNLLRRQKEQIRDAWNTASESVTDLCRCYLEKAPGDTYVATVLGRTLMRTRAYAEALPIWESLSRQDPDDSHNHLQVARCCRSLKMRDRGLAAAETALRLDPDLQEAADVADFLKSLPAVASQGTASR